MRAKSGLGSILVSLIATALAQFPPKPEGVKVLNSKFHEGVYISYKEPGLCETTPGVKSYAGYVHLPPNALNETHEHNDYALNTFYWFFESRKDPHNAPLVIWLNGGPGGSSLLGALSENGPCFVANDSRSTYLNPWSWNNEANLLYIDEPNQVGYSYDVPTNITVDLTASTGDGILPTDFSGGVPGQNSTFLVGTFSSQNASRTANSTQHAAVAMWHFAQTFFEEFPQYKPNDEKISLFTESYGGHYGPTFMSHFMRQNELIANGTISGPGVHYLHLDTLGIINGCIDAYAMFEALINFGYNNTYGIRAINKTQFEFTMSEYTREGGVRDEITACRDLQRRSDPFDHGDREKVNAVCRHAATFAENITNELFVENNLAARFDVTHERQDPFPPPYMFGWLNQAETLTAMGVPVNHSWYSSAVSSAFVHTGDIARGGLLEDIAYVLEHGVKVTLFHGDRDYACNWLGGEKASLQIPWSSNSEFASAGYAPLSLDYPYTQAAGQTRQYGNLSFTRVYQAGHMVPAYQPEAAYAILMRALKGQDTATGTISLQDYAAAHGGQYATSGPPDTWWMKNDILPQPQHECYTLDPYSRCTDEEIGWLRDGVAIVEDWIVRGRGSKQQVSGRVREGHGLQSPLIGDF